ncbi:hypothetical protein RFW85_03415 [Acinetobacter sp. 12966]|uniref:phosphorylase family protein n=1 Tax=Acinetobacter sp. 12966 TaxID=3058488 RepID=UPI002340233C|nr:hypothetical protein [Acinetobacter sp. 12966]MDC5626367.1 hypothetical protein [Acinetobacter baumannii]MDQ9948388.1 hypothetical protein [Acinetobacter sp. 12966]
MNILIIDDNPRRYGELANKLDEMGVAKTDYKIVDCVNSAEDLVRENYYDLIVLDILIPYYNYGEADKQVSLDFFYYLHSDECVKKPEKIIGITSDRSVLENTQSKFQAFTWQIIEYSDSNSEWLNILLAYIDYLIRKNNQREINYNHEVLIVNALIEPELSAILELPWNWKRLVISDSGVLLNSGYIKIEDREVKIAAIHATEMGMVPTAILTTQLIYELNPKIVCMTGICAGYSKEVNLGDIVVASTSWDHQSGKRELSGDKVTFKYSPQYIPILDNIKRDFQNLSQERDFEILKKHINGNSYSPNLRIGPLASSSTVLADKVTLETIVNTQNRDLMGIDMEVFGLYSACHYHFKNIYFFAIKGVCDFADAEKNDDFQEYAAKNSAFTLNLYFQKNLFKLLR